MKFLILILKNLRRNKVRTTLTALAVMVLVAVFSMIFTFVSLLDEVLTDKSKDVKVLVTDRYKLMTPYERSRFDVIVTPGTALNNNLQGTSGFHSEKHTVWSFGSFTLDPEMKDKDQAFFLIGTIPEKLYGMTDGLEAEHVDPRWLELMRLPPKSRLDNAGIVLGETLMKKLKKNLGDVFRAKSILHRDGSAARLPIEMDFEIVGVIPEQSRWNDAGFMDYEYFDRVLRDKKNEWAGRIYYGWLQLDDKESANQAIGKIESYDRDMKVETSATAFARFMEPLQDLMRGIKFVLVPAILCVMTVILANAFSISVRERRTEVGVLKVLGFTGRQVLVLVLGECALVGALAGFLGAAGTYLLVLANGGIPLPQFPVLLMPKVILLWGPVLGTGTALLGGLVPAFSARGVKVAQVFANVA